MATTAIDESQALDVSHKRVILASSLGTVFEWYDFYLYGSLAVIIGKQFFSGLNDASQLVFALLAFAAGFAVRPFGALVFGRIGDLVGRKYTFLITIVIMGLSTFLVGVLPSYGSIGVTAPVILIALRMLQGLALGGEYGGAATYVAEHAPKGKRGLYTSFIQITATFGLFLSLLVILGCKWLLGDKFDDWGWRLPFLLSSLLLAVSVYIRLQLAESPVFKQMKEEGKHSTAPLTESFARWGNLKLVMLALFGATAARRGVVLRPVLRDVFPGQHAEDRRHDHAAADRCGTADRYAVLRGVRLAVGQDRPQAGGAGRLPARRADLLPDLQGAYPLRQPGHRSGQRGCTDPRAGRSRQLQRADRPDREEGIHQLM
jgi:Arabinose efflux permease